MSDFVLRGKIVHLASAWYAVCVHGVRTFASGFQPKPPHGGHPCPRILVPTAKPEATFTAELSPMPGAHKKGPQSAPMVSAIHLRITGLLTSYPSNDFLSTISSVFVKIHFSRPLYPLPGQILQRRALLVLIPQVLLGKSEAPFRHGQIRMAEETALGEGVPPVTQVHDGKGTAYISS